MTPWLVAAAFWLLAWALVGYAASQKPIVRFNVFQVVRVAEGNGPCARARIRRARGGLVEMKD